VRTWRASAQGGEDPLVALVLRLDLDAVAAVDLEREFQRVGGQRPLAALYPN